MKVYTYIIPGDPIPETKVKEANSPRIWDSYKQRRFNFKQYVKNQRNEEPLINGPLKIDATFYCPPTLKHRAVPTLHNLYNFIDTAMKGLVYTTKSEIYEANVKKIISDDAKTVIVIKRIDSE